jgi:hypothetical protein
MCDFFLVHDRAQAPTEKKNLYIASIVSIVPAARGKAPIATPQLLMISSQNSVASYGELPGEIERLILTPVAKTSSMSFLIILSIFPAFFLAKRAQAISFEKMQKISSKLAQKSQ